MKGVKGQFYLLSSIVIITLILALFAVANYTQRKEDTRVEQLGKELGGETRKILEYGAANGGEIDNYPWREFSENFSSYAGRDIEITYLRIRSDEYGALLPGTAVWGFDKDGNHISPPPSYDNEVGPIHDPTSKPIGLWMKFYGTNHTIYYQEGENFYYLITKDIDGERYVATNMQ